jgi:hypothetical protein
MTGSSMHAAVNIHMINPDTFGKQWWKWWRNLQPVWRKNLLMGQIPEEPGSWACLKIGGNNGVVTVVITLSWWGDYAGENKSEWNAAVQDVIFAFSGCLTM